MRAIIVVLAIVQVCVLVGWISFSKGPDRSSINLETDEIRQDTKQVMQSGAELLHKAGDKVEAEANRPTDPAPANQSVPSPAPR